MAVICNNLQTTWWENFVITRSRMLLKCKLRTLTLHKKLISRWDRRTLPPESCHRCKTVPPRYTQL